MDTVKDRTVQGLLWQWLRLALPMQRHSFDFWSGNQDLTWCIVQQQQQKIYIHTHTEHFHHPPNSHMPLQINPSFPHPALENPDLSSIRRFYFFRLSCKWTTQSNVCASHPASHERITRVYSLLLAVEEYSTARIDLCLFIHLSGEGFLGCFQFGEISEVYSINT